MPDCLHDEVAGQFLSRQHLEWQMPVGKRLTFIDVWYNALSGQATEAIVWQHLPICIAPYLFVNILVLIQVAYVTIRNRR